MVNIKQSNFISAVVYLHNCCHLVENGLKLIYEILSDNFSHFEIICVDDGSDDDSADAVKEFVSKNALTCSFTQISMGYFHGIEASMNAGVDLSIGDFVFEFDSLIMDFNAELIMEIYNKSLTGYDIVSARPTSGHDIKSKFFYSVYNRFSDSNYTLGTERFRLLSRRAINRVNSISRSMPYRKAIYASSGLKIANLDFPPHPPPHVTPKTIYTHKARRSRKYIAIDSLILFTNIAYKFSLTLSLIMAALMIIFGVYAVLSWLVLEKVVEGWMPLMVVISAGFFGVFLTVTIMIKYLDVILKIVFKKQKYLISSIKKLS